LLLTTFHCSAIKDTTKEVSQLLLGTNQFDFGQIDKNSKSIATVKIGLYNSGTTPVLILKADTSCKCVKTNFENDEIPPKGTAYLSISIETKELEGPFKKKVYLKTTAKNRVELIKISGNVTD
jgi:hypothetical protein